MAQTWRSVIHQSKVAATEARATTPAVPEPSLRERVMAETCPCTGCAWQDRCAIELLACSAFEAFSDGRRWQVAPRVDATHKRYVKLYSGESR